MQKLMKTRKGATAADRTIGKNLRRFRMEAGLTQTDLGTHLDLTFQQIQKYERGSNRLPSSRMEAICTLLNITPQQLLGLGVDGQPVHRIDELATLGATRAGIDLARAFNNIRDVHQRNAIVTMVEAMSELARVAKPVHTMALAATGT